MSEYHDQQEAKSIQNLLASYGKTLGTEQELIVEREDKDVSTTREIIDIDLNLDVNSKKISTEKCTDTSHNLHSANISSNEFPLILTDAVDLIAMNASYNEDSQMQKSTTDKFHFNIPEKEEWECVEKYGLSKKSRIDLAWERYWSKYGECILWASWIDKYADYINPGYLQDSSCNLEKGAECVEGIEQISERFSEQTTCFPSEAHRNCTIGRSNFEGIFEKTEMGIYEWQKKESSSGIIFSFQHSNKDCVNDKEAEDNRKRIGNQLSPEVGEGWNPLSPFSVEDSYNQPSNAEDEKLLTRCDSASGSIARTNATSDSMTNVTKMTLTSSSCDSTSIQSSSLVSSMTSSNESNVTGSNSDPDNDYIPEDNDKYWQDLWKENFHEQYKKHYEQFQVNYEQKKEQAVIDCNAENNVLPTELLKSSADEQCRLENNQSLEQGSVNLTNNRFEVCSSQKESFMKKKMIMESVGMLMQNLTMSSQRVDEEIVNISSENIRPDGESVDQNNLTNFDLSEDNMKNINRTSSINEVKSSHREDKPITLKRRYLIDNILL